jgi:transposase, IS4 family
MAMDRKINLANQKLLSPQLTLPDYRALVDEALANVKVMNKVIRLGMPVSYRVD